MQYRFVQAIACAFCVAVKQGVQGGAVLFLDVPRREHLAGPAGGLFGELLSIWRTQLSGLANSPISPDASKACPSSFDSSCSRVRPGGRAAGSRSVAIITKV